MKNNIPIFGIIMALLIILRCLLNSSPQLVAVIACINLVALLMVLFSLTTRIKKQGTEKISRVGPVKHFIKQGTKRFCRTVDCGTYILYAVISVMYLLFFKCELGNDIITIVALCFSLSDEYIIATVIDFL